MLAFEDIMYRCRVTGRESYRISLIESCYMERYGEVSDEKNEGKRGREGPFYSKLSF